VVRKLSSLLYIARFEPALSRDAAQARMAEWSRALERAGNWAQRD
jgi:hypothetical protein